VSCVNAMAEWGHIGAAAAGPALHQRCPIATNGPAVGRAPAMRVIGETQPSCRTAAGAPRHVYQHPGRAALGMVLARHPKMIAALGSRPLSSTTTGHCA
jgi:hypothetical protein